MLHLIADQLDAADRVRAVPVAREPGPAATARRDHSGRDAREHDGGRGQRPGRHQSELPGDRRPLERHDHPGVFAVHTRRHLSAARARLPHPQDPSTVLFSLLFPIERFLFTFIDYDCIHVVVDELIKCAHRYVICY